jgi:hypothetical protein
MIIANAISAKIGDARIMTSFIKRNTTRESARILIQPPIMAIAIIRVLLL